MSVKTIKTFNKSYDDQKSLAIITLDKETYYNSIKDEKTLVIDYKNIDQDLIRHNFNCLLDFEPRKITFRLLENGKVVERIIRNIGYGSICRWFFPFSKKQCLYFHFVGE